MDNKQKVYIAWDCYESFIAACSTREGAEKVVRDECKKLYGDQDPKLWYSIEEVDLFP